MNSPTETYLEYIQKYCPTLEPKIVSQITSGLEKTNWDEPTLATDFNNIAVIALIEAENCQDLSLRSLYLEMANEALGSGLTVENHPLCAAHFSLLMSMTGQLQQAVELAWSAWIATVASLDNKLDKKEQFYIIYLPKNKNHLGNLTQFFEMNFNESRLYRQYLMMLSQALCYSSLCFYNSTGIRWLRVAVQGFSDSVELNFKLGVAYIISNQWEGLFFLDRAKELAPTEAKILQALYLAYRDLGNLQLANHWLNLATQLQPQSVNDPDWRWTTLAMDSPFTYVQFESNLLLAVEASFKSIVTSVLVAEGDWFEKEMEFWRNWIKPGMTVIDVGANVGVYTFSAAQRVGSQGKVLAVEPFSGCVRCLEETCRINQFSWVKVCAGAASDRLGSARLSLSASSELNELVANDASVSMESGAFEEVACFTLDGLMEQENLQKVDILKIDAEGHELAVLMGSQRILSEFKPIILYENIAGSQGSNLPVANYLIDQGYNLFHYQPYLQDLIPLDNLNALQGNLNIIALPIPEEIKNIVSDTSNVNFDEKAEANDFIGRFREIISDPLNLVIERDPRAGTSDGNLVYLHNGLKVPFAGNDSYYGGFSSILIMNRGVHEPLEEFVFQQVLKRLPARPNMLELGAYWGHYSMWLKVVHPDATVILVEPESQNIQAGKKNFKLNGINGLFLQNFVGKGHFSVDQYLIDNHIDQLSILHSDIQGYEIEMLTDCNLSLSSKIIDYLFISTHSQELHHGVIEELRRLNYRIEVSSNFEETTSYDGFILASSPLVDPIFKNFIPMNRTQIINSNSSALIDYIDIIKSQILDKH